MAIDDNMERKEFKIKWPVDTGPAIYVNNFVIQQADGGVAYLSFFQVAPPLIIGTDEDLSEASERTAEVEARPIVKLAVTQDQLRSIAKVLHKYVSDL